MRAAGGRYSPGKSTKHVSNKDKQQSNQKSAPILSPEEKAKRAADIAERQKAQAQAKGAPASGSKAARVEEATKPGVVKPSESKRPTKIPPALNATSGGKKPVKDDTDTTTEGSVEGYAERKAREGADEEMDENVAAAADKPKKKEKDPNVLTVGDVAREEGADPKRVRSRLRAGACKIIGETAVEGRWPKIKRDSDEHKALVKMIADDKKAEEEGEEGEENEEGDDEGEK